MKSVLNIIRYPLGIIIMIIGIVEIFSNISGIATNKDKNNRQQKDKFILVSSEMTTDTTGCTIKGTIKNNTDKMYKSVSVKFNLYDPEGNQIGTAYDYISNFQSSGTWKYNATEYTTDTIDKYELYEISGW